MTLNDLDSVHCSAVVPPGKMLCQDIAYCNGSVNSTKKTSTCDMFMWVTVRNAYYTLKFLS